MTPSKHSNQQPRSGGGGGDDDDDNNNNDNNNTLRLLRATKQASQSASQPVSQRQLASFGTPDITPVLASNDRPAGSALSLSAPLPS